MEEAPAAGDAEPGGTTPTQVVAKFLPVDSAAAIALGARPLKPEKSLNGSAGVTYETGPLHLTVDAYQIRAGHRIVKTEFLGTTVNGGAAVAAILAANGIAGVNSAQFFINGVDSRTRGVDAVADYTLRTGGAGTFRLSAAYSYAKTKILRIADDPAVLAPLNVTLFAHQAQSDLTRGLPHNKLVLTSDWSLGRAHALARLTRFAPRYRGEHRAQVQASPPSGADHGSSPIAALSSPPLSSRRAALPPAALRPAALVPRVVPD